MSKNNMPKQRQKTAPQPRAAAVRPAKAPRRPWMIPVVPVFFVMMWAWAALYYGDVLRMCRENSFWVPSTSQMAFILEQKNGAVWYVGRMLLQLFRYPWLGGAVLSLMLSFSAWLVNYILCLPGRLRFLGYMLPLAYVGVVSYQGLDVYFETETGRLMGIPALVLGVLCLLALVRMLLLRGKAVPALVTIPRDETPWQNRMQLVLCALVLAATVGFVQWQRPYMRVIHKMMVQVIDQDWQGTMETARKHAEQSNRPMAAFYAVGLVHTDQQCDRLYDIRLDYDSLYVHGWDGSHNNGNNVYIEDCSYHAGLIQTAYHTGMERMVMDGPSVHNMELMVKCALMRSEWQLARKYLRILQDVPFEKPFCEKYRPMLYAADKVNADSEMAHIRLTEPIHDSFENWYQQPVFMGYNLKLYEGRSMNALQSSLAVCLYTKVMPDFMARLQPLAGGTLPENIADGVLLMTNKNPKLETMFKGLELRAGRLQNFMQNVKPYMSDRPGNARMLFDRYKGYYPYYYFFGNLKATKKRETTQSSNSGVN